MYIGRYLRSGSLIPDNFHEVLLKQAQNEGEIEKIEEEFIIIIMKFFP